MRRFVGLGAIMLIGCQSVGVDDGPAVLTDMAPSNLEALESGLATAMGKARIELGAGDPSQSSTVAVLPPPVIEPETRSPVLPILFDLELREGACVAVNRETGAVFDLPDVRCQPVPKSGSGS